MGSSHQAQVPTAAAEYFKRFEHDVSAAEHPVITQVFWDGRGWRQSTLRKRVSVSWLKKLRNDGASAVVLSAYGHDVDFTIAELIKVDRTPLLGGSLLGSRRAS